ncbi:hypothetical protein PPL_07235 [Heterostelium album PN500]|uniref:Uncharacterized protein n=1 Tax=Heterostelium pallidum (strain ATCC 26659 / Pp 5 / PN500) TaxID=670386 RepID=D3BES0_HETP5|nr:hypothetical protein PPL_07235 [Heterostelium album PN500]EFA80401.1 hypothetical protein PPL_07235 [Heterostelium album PN500]|eukprot:XP_020432521.1 hypothetical protein PPL_07235 [Heterostelium album PN500]
MFGSNIKNILAPIKFTPPSTTHSHDVADLGSLLDQLEEQDSDEVLINHHIRNFSKYFSSTKQAIQNCLIPFNDRLKKLKFDGQPLKFASVFPWNYTT